MPFTDGQTLGILMSHDPQSLRRILRLPEVERRTGRARSSIYRDVDRGLFPRPVKPVSYTHLTLPTNREV